MGSKGSTVFGVFYLGVFFFIVIGSTFAEEDTSMDGRKAALHKENVERMLEMMGVPEQVNQAANDVVKLYATDVAGETTDPNVGKVIQAYKKDLSTIVSSVLSWEAIKPNYINAYARRMAPMDVTKVNEFLQSEVGKNFSTAQLSATQELKSTTQHLVEADMAPPMASLTAKLREAMAKLAQINIQNKSSGDN